MSCMRLMFLSESCAAEGTLKGGHMWPWGLRIGFRNGAGVSPLPRRVHERQELGASPGLAARTAQRHGARHRADPADTFIGASRANVGGAVLFSAVGHAWQLSPGTRAAAGTENRGRRGAVALAQLLCATRC